MTYRVYNHIDIPRYNDVMYILGKMLKPEQNGQYLADRNSPVARLFLQQLVQTNNTENVNNAPHYEPIVRGTTHHWLRICGFP